MTVAILAFAALVFGLEIFNVIYRSGLTFIAGMLIIGFFILNQKILENLALTIGINPTDWLIVMTAAEYFLIKYLYYEAIVMYPLPWEATKDMNGYEMFLAFFGVLNIFTNIYLAFYF